MYKLTVYDEMGSFDEMFFNDFEKVKMWVCNCFLKWFFDAGKVIEFEAEYEQVSDALDFFKKTVKEDVEELYFDEVFCVEEVKTID